ncbi:MAG TPA: GspE/PulE family protein [bacterium]|nr:GspE/PulE family protein [bacterium]HPT29390.1 GspE/PulE family protein [bacterium]
MSGFDSINALLSQKTGGDDSPQGKLLAKETELKSKKQEEQTEAQAAASGLGYINLFGFPISPEAIGLISEEEARANKIVCFYYDGENIRLGLVGAVTPSSRAIIDHLNNQYFTNSRLYLISELSFNYALELYKILPKIKKYESGVEIKPEDLKRFEAAISSYKNLNEEINKVNISDVVTLMLATALKVGASDIHIEAEAQGIVVRLRIDGVLQEAAVIDKLKWKKIISRMKILAGVKINIEDKPQDGRYSIYLDNEIADVRSSFLPTAYGESVVMRLLKSQSVGLPFEELGLRPESFQLLKVAMEKPNGLILTTGPTGSGKTTTLYAILNKLNQPGTKIITLEDPIEYQLKGISQSQVDPKKGYTFAEGLRSILRQDPNVIMVGEIRDVETAEIAVQASLTGHLVLSTLHTNDASGVIPRLVDMGVKPFFLTPAVNAVLGQRLVRQLCPKCKQAHVLNSEEEEQVKKILAVVSPKAGINIPSTLPAIYKVGPGCEFCNGIGYKGRIGIYEVFTMDDKIKQLTNDGAPAFKILQQAIENGMVTMLQDGVLKVLDGTTSLEEVYRVAGDFDYVNELYDIVISQTMGRGIKISLPELEQAQGLLKQPQELSQILAQMPTKQLLHLVSALAVKEDAGDIHIEPAEGAVKIRFRIDGVLHDIITLPFDHYLPLLSEVKILSGFATNVKQATMDGRFVIIMPDKKIDCRVSIISGGYGETVVVRLLTGAGANLSLDALGIAPYTLPVIKEAMKKTRGIIINTGPTGSGKTTTLYSILRELNKPDVKIITVEDPIEYRLEGLIQTQIDNAAGYTFAMAMRSLLRQNPNIMMIGEIRDEETAKIAIEASLTGHLVLSTIHANSAAGAISRFVGLGVDRQQLANAIECAIGQRLARRLCPHCKTEAFLDENTKTEVKKIISQITNPLAQIPLPWKTYKAVGCEQCGFLGYKGRLGLYEAVGMNADIQKAIQNINLTDMEVETLAVQAGMITMMQDGLVKALNGETTVEEVFRVCA